MDPYLSVIQPLWAEADYLGLLVQSGDINPQPLGFITFGPKDNKGNLTLNTEQVKNILILFVESCLDCGQVVENTH